MCVLVLANRCPENLASGVIWNLKYSLLQVRSSNSWIFLPLHLCVEGLLVMF